jgi:hypothetical protein
MIKIYEITKIYKFKFFKISEIIFLKDYAINHPYPKMLFKHFIENNFYLRFLKLFF